MLAKRLLSLRNSVSRVAPALTLTVSLFACGGSSSDPTPLTYPSVSTTTAPKVLTTTSAGVKVFGGGYGSALAQNPNDPAVFYLLTDRGPSVEAASGLTSIFPVPTFTPQIGKFRLDGDSLQLVETILLKNSSGTPFSGLPTPAASGIVTELARNAQGQTLPGDPNGLDPEGLVSLSDGTFWISESYGPSLLHVDASGKTLERIGPTSTGRALPKVLARRRPGRGLNGLTFTPDGKTLVGLMQSPLYNPAATHDASRSLRLLTFDLTTGATRQFVYLLDNPTYAGVSDLVALSNDTFLVLERDGNFLKNGTTPAKLLYKISLADATDVSDPANGEAGRLVNGKTIDFASPAELQANGIKTVQKTLVADLLKILPGYPHDKPEGLSLLSPSLLALSNDDDFGITAGSDGNPAQKRLPFTGNVDRGAVYFIRLDAPLK